MSEETPVDQETGVVVDDQEQLGPHRGVGFRPGHVWPHQHVGDPALVGARRLIAAECLGLGLKGGAVQAATVQLVADGAFRHRNPVTVPKNRGDLGRRARRDLEAQSRRLGEEFRVGPDHAGVGPGCGRQGGEATAPPGTDPPVDGVARVAALVSVRVGMGPVCRGAHQCAPFGLGQPVGRCLGDDRPAVKRNGLVVVVIHLVSSSVQSLMGQEA